MTDKQLEKAVQVVYPNAVYVLSYTITMDDVGNATINSWNSDYGTQPTSDQLTAAWSQYQLTQAQKAQLEVIQTAYAAARYGTPITVTVGENALTFPVDLTTQNNVTGYLVAFNGLTPPATVPLLDASGTIQNITYADLQTLGSAIAVQSISAWTTMMTLEAEVKASNTIDQVQTVVWS